MKNLLALILIVVYSLNSFGQDKQNTTSVVGVHVGSSLVASLYLSKDNWTPEVEKTSVTQLTYDYMMRKGFSIGATVAYQSADLTLVDTLTELSIEEGKIDRIYIGARTLWHYGKNPKWDLYSGVKFGMILFSPSGIKKNHQDKSIIAEEHTRSSPRVGLIPIGCRYYVTDNVAFGAQMSLGVPTLATFNFNYAF